MGHSQDMKKGQTDIRPSGRMQDMGGSGCKTPRREGGVRKGQRRRGSEGGLPPQQYGRSGRQDKGERWINSYMSIARMSARVASQKRRSGAHCGTLRKGIPLKGGKHNCTVDNTR